MAYVLSSVSGNLISAASAGFAPTNSADVSAIASAYQVVSATATQLNAGTAYLTSVNETPISASRAGNAANASLANSAWYDGTGRLISALPDSAAVSSIASSYAESAASGKLDSSSQVVTSTGSASAMMMGGTTYYASQINGLYISAQKAYVADEWMHAGNKLDATASAKFYTTANESGYVDSAYVESQVSGKQDALTFDWDADSAISSINGSALAGQGGGGGASIPFTGYYYDSATSATSVITADVTAVSSLAYTKYNGNVVNAYKGITDSQGIHHLGVASFIDAGAEINRDGYTLAFAPSTSMWKTSDVATGIFAPLQYGTGAGMFLNNGPFKGYLKGNEMFVCNTSIGQAARVEVHQSRGAHLCLTADKNGIVSGNFSPSGVVLSNGASHFTANLDANNNRGAALRLFGGTSSASNSQTSMAWLTPASLQVSNTASGTAKYAINSIALYDTDTSAQKTISSTSIDYWNAKLDSAELSAYVAKSAYDDLYSAFTALSGVISTYSAYFSSISAKVDNSAIGVIE
jgi:hypothetical protein